MIRTFEFLINTGVSSVEGIVDPKERAMVCAELAKAIAMSGVLREPEVEETAEQAEEKKEAKRKAASKGKGNSKKEALKTENQKEETVTPVKEEVAVPETPAVPEEPVAPAVEEEVVKTPAVAPTEVEIVDEWTDEMLTLKAEQLELLNSYVAAWGEEYVYNDCLGYFSEGAFAGAENVRPSNIDGFVVYLNQLAEQFAQE